MLLATRGGVGRSSVQCQSQAQPNDIKANLLPELPPPSSLLLSPTPSPTSYYLLPTSYLLLLLLLLLAPPPLLSSPPSCLRRLIRLLRADRSCLIRSQNDCP